MRARARKLLWPGLFTLVVVILTLGLGIWQIKRLAWKTALLDQITASELSPPTTLSDAIPFGRVVAEGHFLPGTARYGVELQPTANGMTLGSQVLAPFQPAGSLPIIVDRGWAPNDVEISSPTDKVRIEGYLRPSESPRFGNVADNAAQKQFYTLNTETIAAALRLGAVVPAFLVALGPPDTLPRPAASLPQLPNNHLYYAITWFTLAITSAVIFLLYARNTAREM